MKKINVIQEKAIDALHNAGYKNVGYEIGTTLSLYNGYTKKMLEDKMKMEMELQNKKCQGLL
jgi:putative N-acetylmannosamine-6-phosphate epimerase